MTTLSNGALFAPLALATPSVAPSSCLASRRGYAVTRPTSSSSRPNQTTPQDVLLTPENARLNLEKLDLGLKNEANQVAIFAGNPRVSHLFSTFQLQISAFKRSLFNFSSSNPRIPIETVTGEH